MKKTILTLTAFAFLAGATLTSCNSPAKKVENAQEDVTAAKVALEKAEAEYLADVENYRKETDARIKANNEALAEFNTRMLNEKREAKADYQKEIARLEQKNIELKKRLDDYNEEGRDNWEKFKAEFNHDMEELAKAFKDLTVKNVE